MSTTTTPEETTATTTTTEVTTTTKVATTATTSTTYKTYSVNDLIPPGADALSPTGTAHSVNPDETRGHNASDYLE